MNSTSQELPIDNVGCFSNLSFSWVRDFLIQPHDELIMDKSNRISYDLPHTDRATVNGKRLLEIYKDEKQSRGTKDVSMLKIAWKFCKTRVIVASIFWTMSIILYLLSPVIFLKMTLEALDYEHTRNITTYEENAEGGKEINYVDLKFNNFSNVQSHQHHFPFLQSNFSNCSN